MSHCRTNAVAIFLCGVATDRCWQIAECQCFSSCQIGTYTPDFLQKKHFSRLYSGSHSFGHYPTHVIIGENRNENRSENRKLCFHRELSFQYNRSVKLAHYCTCFSNTGVQFVVQSTVIRECDYKILKLLRLLESDICLKRTLYRVSWLGFIHNFSFNRTNFHSNIQTWVWKSIKWILKITFIWA